MYRYNPLSLTRVFFIVILLLHAAGLAAEEKPYAPESMPGAVSITAEEMIELILSRPDITIIDSRKKNEYQKGHIEGAINLLNTSMQQQDLEVIVPDRNSVIIFYCNGERCLRSSDAIRKAMDWGYKNLFWFRGGWNEWSEKRLPVISD